MRASKWLSCQLLLDDGEMESLLQSLPPFRIYIVSCLCPAGKSELSQADFLACYRTYVHALKQGLLPDEATYRHIFSTAFTTTPHSLFVVSAEHNQELMRIAEPVVQLQNHYLAYSTADGKFRAMTFGNDHITWGIQFSYPQLFQDPVTQDALQVDISDRFPNTQLFRQIQHWMRQHTVPTPFIVNGQKINIPMRLGKDCFSWINHHPQLRQKGFQIATGGAHAD